MSIGNKVSRPDFVVWNSMNSFETQLRSISNDIKSNNYALQIIFNGLYRVNVERQQTIQRY